MDSFLETPLAIFIDAHRTEKGEIGTFTGMGTMRGKFMVKENDYAHFLDLLYEYLFVQQRRPLNLIEQRRCDLNTPILIDLDFKYPPERAILRQFDISHIHKFVELYVEHLACFYNLGDKHLRFFITLRPAPYEDKKTTNLNRSIKDGVHIQCPDLILHSEHQQVLRHRSLEKNDISQAFRNTGYINSEKDIFDEAIVKKNGWFYYGESKPDIPAYHLVSVYIYNPITKFFYEDVQQYSSKQLISLLSIRHQLSIVPIEIEEKHEEEWNQRLQHCIGKKAMIEESIIEIPINLKSSNVREQFQIDTINLAKQLAIECLSIDRSTSYQSWMEVGWCLYAIDSSQEMFEVWMDFSKKSLKYNGTNVYALQKDWNRGWGHIYREKQFTIRSLHLWAQTDNPKKYYEIMKNSFINFVESEVDATHTHIARLMKKMYGNTFCAALTSKTVDWFEFTGVYWKKLPQGIDLRNKMTTEVAEIIIEARRTIRERLQQANTDQSFIDTRMKKMLKIETGLYTSGFKDSVMKDCIGLFYEEDFIQKLNSNPYLIGFKNGVIDLHSQSSDEGDYTVLFRKAEPTDFISFMAGRCSTKNCDPIDYIEYNPNDPEQQLIYLEIDDFMSKLFPNKELCTYMWRKLASCLEGTNTEQTYETWIGVGGNGKSKLVDLMSIVLGDYASSLQSTALTRKRPDSGAANPDIMAIRNKRFIYMAEPDDREPLNTSRMKQFTGEDDVEARGLFEDQSKFKIAGKIFMLCNAFPAILTMDRGTWRRIRAVPFESKFVDPLVEKENIAENIYYRDPKLDVNLKKWRTLFMSRLVHIYKTQYLHNGLGAIPAIVTQESSKYQESFDSVAKFTNARIREISKGGFSSNIKDIYRNYKQWYEGMGGGMGRKLTQIDLYKRLSDKYGEPYDKKTFKQLRLFDDENELEEYDKSL